MKRKENEQEERERGYNLTERWWFIILSSKSGGEGVPWKSEAYH